MANAQVFGSGLATASDAIRQELIRREQQQRQAALDLITQQKVDQEGALNAATVDLTQQQRDTQRMSAEASAESTKSLANTRKQAERDAFVAQMERKHQPGDVLSLAETAKMKEYEIEDFAGPGADGQNLAWKGTTAQRETGRQQKYWQDTLDGKFDAMFTDPGDLANAKKEAFYRLGGATNVPAGVVVPKQPTETVADQKLKLTADWSMRYAQAGGRTEPNLDDKTRAADKVAALGTQTRQDVAAPIRDEAADVRRDTQNAARYDRAYNSAVSAIDRARQPIFDQFRRAQRMMDTLHQEGGALDAVAVPEFLTVMAGGFGSGLRMSEAELNRIFGSQSKTDQFKSAVSQWTATGMVPPLLIQPQMRTNMKRMGEQLVKRVDGLLGMYEDYEGRLAEADSSSEVNKIRAEMRKAEHTAAVEIPGGEKKPASAASTGWGIKRGPK